jgi:alkylation response protein AidB-like acyl-CoA dehydrogenase
MVAVAERARLIADEVLFPAAIETDRAALVPTDHLDLLAREGFYGIAGPREAGGGDLDRGTANRVIEILASGCLSSTFVWLQHHNPVRAVAGSPTPGLRDAWLAPLCRGDRRAGIALAGERPGPPLVHAERADGGFVLNGEAPWVTGWGLIDVVMVAARVGAQVVRGLVEAIPGPTLEVEPLRLVAANATGTVTIRFHDHVLAADRVVSVEPHADMLGRDAAGLRTNGSLALGVADRCRALIGSGDLDGELAATRSELDAATAASLPAARARASELALRATAALIVAEGARSILIDRHAQRLAREALFLLVFGSRPAIRTALFDTLVRRSAAPPSLA